MKRILKSRLFSFILGLVLMGTISVLTYSYSAKDISFSPSNTSWKVNNVKSAIDSIKNTNDVTISGLENDISTKWEEQNLHQVQLVEDI